MINPKLDAKTVVPNVKSEYECASKCDDSDNCVALSWCESNVCRIFNAEKETDESPLVVSPVSSF